MRERHGERPRETRRPKIDAAIIEHGTSGAPQSLTNATRAALEPSFGHSFANIRIHANERAGESARELGADAYTVGSDIVFAPGAYDADSQSGKELLAHELTHTVQQRAIDGGVSVPAELALSDPHGAIEVEARSAATAAMSGESAPVSASSGVLVARSEDDEKQASVLTDEKSVAPPDTAPHSTSRAPVSFPGDVPGEPDPMADVPEHDPLGAAAKWLFDGGVSGLVGKAFGLPGWLLKGIGGMDSDESPDQRAARKRHEDEQNQ